MKLTLTCEAVSKVCGKMLSKFLRSFVLLKEVSDLEKHTKSEMLSTTNRESEGKNTET